MSSLHREYQTEVVLAEPGQFLLRQGSLAEPAPGEARLRIHRIGVCGTDWHAFRGRQPFFEYPRVLGHELAAEIVAVNGPSEFSVGDLVAVEPYLNDPDSPASQKGKTNCCESLRCLGVHCDGGMRPEINMPIKKLLHADGIALEQIALVEMLCIGAHAVNRANPDASETALVLGAGPIGMSVITFLRSRVDRLVVADLDAARLAFCREGLGVKETLRLSEGINLERAVRDAFSGQLPDLVFDATGSGASMRSTFRLAAHGGKIIFVGLFLGEIPFDDPNFHRRELTLLASRNATSGEFSQVLNAIERGEVDVSSWITHRMRLEEVPERFPILANDPTVRKAVIEV